MSTHAGGAMPLRPQGVVELASWQNEGGPSPRTVHRIERLDWASFLAHFYPHARSHDYESLAAYIEYQKHPEQT